MKFYLGLISLHIFLWKMRATSGACIKLGCLVQRRLCRKVNLPASWEARRPLCHKVNLLSCVARRPYCHIENLPSCVARRPLFHKVNLPRCEARRRLFTTRLWTLWYILFAFYYLVFALYFLVFALCLIKLHCSQPILRFKNFFHVYYYDEKQVTFK